MKKLSVLLTLAMLICLFAACGSSAESTQTDVLYAVFYADEAK